MNSTRQGIFIMSDLPGDILNKEWFTRMALHPDVFECALEAEKTFNAFENQMAAVTKLIEAPDFETMLFKAANLCAEPPDPSEFVSALKEIKLNKGLKVTKKDQYWALIKGAKSNFGPSGENENQDTYHMILSEFIGAMFTQEEVGILRHYFQNESETIEI